MREVLFVAGETSGDLLAGGVAAALRARAPSLPLAAVGGPRLRAAGAEILEDSEQLAAIGFVEVIRHIPRHWRLLRRLQARLRSGGVGLVVLIDYPGFNMRVAEAAHDAGVPVLYFSTPQVWAWGADRLPKLAAWTRAAAVILPFEEAFLRAHGINATFVGHPMLDRAQHLPSREEACAQLGLDASRPVLAVFPGSRGSELRRHVAPFVETARRVLAARPDVQVVVSAASGVRLSPDDCPFPIVADASFTVLRAATAGLLKSGTTTLEAAVAGLPHIIAYRTSGVSYAIARRVVKLPHIGLVNVVAEKEVSREFVQDAVEPEAMAEALLPLLDANGPTHAAAVAALRAVRDRLGAPGAAERVADMVLALLADGAPAPVAR